MGGGRLAPRCGSQTRGPGIADRQSLPGAAQGGPGPPPGHGVRSPGAGRLVPRPWARSPTGTWASVPLGQDQVGAEVRLVLSLSRRLGVLCTADTLAACPATRVRGNPLREESVLTKSINHKSHRERSAVEDENALTHRNTQTREDVTDGRGSAAVRAKRQTIKTRHPSPQLPGQDERGTARSNEFPQAPAARSTCSASETRKPCFPGGTGTGQLEAVRSRKDSGSVTGQHGTNCWDRRERRAAGGRPQLRPRATSRQPQWVSVSPPVPEGDGGQRTTELNQRKNNGWAHAGAAKPEGEGRGQLWILSAAPDRRLR